MEFSIQDMTKWMINILMIFPLILGFAFLYRYCKELFEVDSYSHNAKKEDITTNKVNLYKYTETDKKAMGHILAASKGRASKDITSNTARLRSAKNTASTKNSSSSSTMNNDFTISTALNAAVESLSDYNNDSSSSCDSSSPNDSGSCF